MSGSGGNSRSSSNVIYFNHEQQAMPGGSDTEGCHLRDNADMSNVKGIINNIPAQTPGIQSNFEVIRVTMVPNLN